MAEDDGPIFVEGDNGALETVGARAAVEDSINAAVEPVEDMGGRGGGDEAEEVGAGRGERQADPLEEQTRDGMGGDAETDGGQFCSDNVGDDRGTRQDERDGSGPEGCSEEARGVGNRGCERKGLVCRGQMDNERVKRGSPFGLEDAPDRDGVEGICREPVNGLGGHGDEPSVSQDRGCLVEAPLVG